MNDELADFKKINETLKKDFLCLPPYNSTNGGFLDKVWRSLIANQEIKYHITAEIILPYRNVINNIFLKKNLAKEEITNTRNFIIFSDKQWDLLKKIKNALRILKKKKS